MLRALYEHGVAADLVHPLRLHALAHLRVARHALAAPLLDALRAGAAGAQPAGRELRFLPVVPAHEEVPLVVEGQIGGPDRRFLGLAEVTGPGRIVPRRLCSQAVAT